MLQRKTLDLGCWLTLLPSSPEDPCSWVCIFASALFFSTFWAGDTLFLLLDWLFSRSSRDAGEDAYLSLLEHVAVGLKDDDRTLVLVTRSEAVFTLVFTKFTRLSLKYPTVRADASSPGLFVLLSERLGLLRNSRLSASLTSKEPLPILRPDVFLEIGRAHV